MTSMNPIVFRTSRPLTIGVELEFQVLDRHTLNLAPRAPDILETVPPELSERIKPEFIRSMIEVNTVVCDSMADAEANLADLCRQAQKLASQCGCLLYAASLHPFALSQEQLLSENPRYHHIMNDLQLVGRRFISQGLHVHIGLPDGETAIRVCDSIRTYLPILLAITTSSPFYEGVDTGLKSYRAKLFEALPHAGMPDSFGNWHNFQRLATLLYQTGIIREIRDLWWDVRPHPDFGTIEIRICDLPSHFDEIVAVAALIQALVSQLTEGGATRQTNMQVLRHNKWQAARYGLDGRFVDLDTMDSMSLKETAEKLLDRVAPSMQNLGSGAHLVNLYNILERGTSADRQRQIYEEDSSQTAIIEKLQKEFWR